MELHTQSEEEVLARVGEEFATGIFVRAKTVEGKWESVDIVKLTPTSLLEWLRSRGGNNPWAENVVGILLGHDNIAG